MKKDFIKKYVILLLLVIIPILIKADTLAKPYGESITKTNNYITGFKDRRKYLLFNVNYVYEKNGYGSNSLFTTGGMLSKSEFELTILNGLSYLSSGKEYWTLTASTEGNNYYIDSYLQTKSINMSSGTRVTQYVKPGTIVEGKGTYSNPWTFEEGFVVDIISNNTNYGTVTPSTAQYVKSGDSIRYELIPRQGYFYNGNKDDCHLVKDGIDPTDNRYIISRVTNDITCTAVFELQAYKFNLEIGSESTDYNNNRKTYTTSPNYNPIYYKYRTDWYSDNAAGNVINSITSPVISGWTFNGYYYGGTKVIESNGNILVKNLELTNYGNVNQSLIANISKNHYTLSYTLNGGTQGTNHPTTATYDEVVQIDNPKKAGYEFDGWTFNGNTTTARAGTSSNDVNTSFATSSKATYFANLTPTNNGSVTMSATWIACPAGTYNDGTSATCMACPAGTYTNTSGQTSCQPCEDGFYCAGGTNREACPAGTEGTGTGKSTLANGCSDCQAGKYASSPGTATCSTCEAGTYNTTTGNTTCNVCPAGKYCTGGSNNTTCPAGRYRLITGGRQLSDCTTCEDGYYCVGGTDRNSCPVGTEGTGTGKSTLANGCSDCPAGKYAQNEGSANCSICPVNKYSGTKASSCTSCPGVMTSPQQSTSIYACSITCNGGQYLKKNESSCRQCTAGSYCPGGTYNYSTTEDQGIIPCPGGANSPAGSSSVSQCGITCSAGNYLKKNESSCRQCPAGSYCAGGTFTYSSTQDQGITACPGSMTSPVGSSQKTNCSITCEAGKYLKANEGTCSFCTVNYYCTGGTYNFNASSNQGISPCKSGFTSPAGSRQCSKFESCLDGGEYCTDSQYVCYNDDPNNPDYSVCEEATCYCCVGTECEIDIHGDCIGEGCESFSVSINDPGDEGGCRSQYPDEATVDCTWDFCTNFPDCHTLSNECIDGETTCVAGYVYDPE